MIEILPTPGFVSADSLQSPAGGGVYGNVFPGRRDLEVLDSAQVIRVYSSSISSAVAKPALRRAESQDAGGAESVNACHVKG